MTYTHKVPNRLNGRTRVLPVDASKVGHFVFQDPDKSFLGNWQLELCPNSPDAVNLQEAALQLQANDTPVAFPTETVYGLGADATRSSAVRGIYKAKQRPSDNPLIVHISSLAQLRALLTTGGSDSSTIQHFQDPIPSIYFSLISRFWPGPLSILLPLPAHSPFASEVTNSLRTVAIRMPSSRLALALISLAGVPLAAPSANSSSKPSPTTAAHVLHDLTGQIDIILDGGPCTVGMESTVVDGLAQPPVILRPGGISIDKLRQCPGWQDVQAAYENKAEVGAPRAPGMKYKHYSPRARVILLHGRLSPIFVKDYVKGGGNVGFLSMKGSTQGIFQPGQIEPEAVSIARTQKGNKSIENHSFTESITKRPGTKDALQSDLQVSIPSAQHSRVLLSHDNSLQLIDVWTVALGPEPVDVARGLFSALRELDQKGVNVILVECMDDSEGDAAAAVMNRIRKAAEAEIVL